MIISPLSLCFNDSIFYSEALRMISAIISVPFGVMFTISSRSESEKLEKSNLAFLSIAVFSAFKRNQFSLCRIDLLVFIVFRKADIDDADMNVMAMHFRPQ